MSVADRKDPHQFILSVIHSTNTKCSVDVKLCSRDWRGNTESNISLSSWSLRSITERRARSKNMSRISLERAGSMKEIKQDDVKMISTTGCCLTRCVEKACLRTRPDGC